jgi:hypothetical protein
MKIDFPDQTARGRQTRRSAAAFVIAADLPYSSRLLCNRIVCRKDCFPPSAHHSFLNEIFRAPENLTNADSARCQELLADRTITATLVMIHREASGAQRLLANNLLPGGGPAETVSRKPLCSDGARKACAAKNQSTHVRRAEKRDARRNMQNEQSFCVECRILLTKFSNCLLPIL